MKNPTGTDLPVSQKNGADSTYQYTISTNEIALAAILANRLGIKLRDGDLISIKEDINSKFGSRRMAAS